MAKVIIDQRGVIVTEDDNDEGVDVGGGGAGNSVVFDLKGGKQRTYVNGVKQVEFEPKFYAALAANMTDTMGDTVDWMKNHISGSTEGSGGTSYASMFDGKKIVHAGGGFDMFDNNAGGFDSSWGGESGGQSWVAVTGESAKLLVASASLKMAIRPSIALGMGGTPYKLTVEGDFEQNRGVHVIGSSDFKTGDNVIQLFMTASSAGGTPAQNEQIRQGGPTSGSIFLFTDGTELYLKRDTGAVRKIFTQAT